MTRHLWNRSPLTRRTAIVALASAFGVFGLSALAAEPAEHPLKPALKYSEECLEKCQALSAYEATFQKRELVGSSMVNQRVRMKVRHEPFSIYLYFEEPHDGREVIYVEGRNNNNLLVHETGLAGLIGTLELSPTGDQAMAENRYPITKAGMVNMVKTLIEQWRDESQYGECEVKYYKDAKVGKYTCKVIESIHPRPRRQFKFHMTRLWIDDETGYPVRIQQFGFPKSPEARPPVIEDYVFTDIRTETRITDRDFDVNNPRYNF